MTSKNREINEEKDKITSEIVDLSDRYISMLTEYQKISSMGHLNLTQAKCILGPTRISPIYFDKRMKSGIEVNIKKLEDGDTEIEAEKTTELKDPTQWFGVLVPQSLKQSRDNFSTGLNLLVEAAQLQATFRQLQNRLQSVSQDLSQIDLVTVTPMKS